jgi:hypothetical protein
MRSRIDRKSSLAGSKLLILHILTISGSHNGERWCIPPDVLMSKLEFLILFLLPLFAELSKIGSDG